MEKHQFFMNQALKLAKTAYDQGEVPVAALLVRNDLIIAQNFNTKEQDQQVLAHAELKVITEASKKLGTWRLNETQLYVTLEPCLMCAGALIEARVSHVIYGCSDSEGGFFSTQMHKKNELIKIQITSGIEQEKCSELLTQFFKSIR